MILCFHLLLNTNAVFHPLTGDLTDADNLLTVAVDRANNKEAALKAANELLVAEMGLTIEEYIGMQAKVDFSKA